MSVIEWLALLSSYCASGYRYITPTGLRLTDRPT